MGYDRSSPKVRLRFAPTRQTGHDLRGCRAGAGCAGPAGPAGPLQIAWAPVVHWDAESLGVRGVAGSGEAWAASTMNLHLR